MRTFICVFLIFSLTKAAGQDEKINFILSLPSLQAPAIDTSLLHNALFLALPFARHQPIEQTPGIGDIKRIERIDLAYSSYRQNPSFDQKALNRKRLQAFAQAHPDLFALPAITWTCIETTDCNTPENCRGTFHGFILHYRPKGGNKETEKEIAYLNNSTNKASSLSKHNYTDEKLITKTPKSTDNKACLKKNRACTISESDKADDVLTEKQREDLYDFLEDKSPCLLYSSGTYLCYVFDHSLDLKTHSTQYNSSARCAYGAWDLLYAYLAKQSGLLKRIYADGGIARLSITAERIDRQPSLTAILNTYPCYNEGLKANTAKELYLARRDWLIERDSLIHKVFGRTGWDSILLVEDLTHSMAPYTAQILRWQQTNHDKISHYVFFNDGDHKTGTEKTIGQTGGLYHTAPLPYPELLELMARVMRAGHGGDVPENNVEALIYATRLETNYRHCVMIADNHATPRDLSLAHTSQKPLHIILCGAEKGINPAYLDLARTTRGSLHTLSSDVENLHKLSEGQTIAIDGETFRLRNGKFTRTY
jgi:hypothetical protein